MDYCCLEGCHPFPFFLNDRFTHGKHDVAENHSSKDEITQNPMSQVVGGAEHRSKARRNISKVRALTNIPQAKGND